MPQRPSSTIHIKPCEALMKQTLFVLSTRKERVLIAYHRRRLINYFFFFFLMEKGININLFIPTTSGRIIQQ